ncbi:MAG: ABC-2 family transporter protein [Bacilli bacterium]|nr:ABC-2 family transporter protein [Bacilli bacterium]
MKLYFKYLVVAFKSELQYKWSFLLAFLSQIVIVFTSYFMITSLFDKFGNIKGFTVHEVLLTFAVIQFGFSFSEVFFRGVDKFDRLIVEGGYDRLLIRPRNIFLQVLGSEFQFVKLSRMLQAIIILGMALLQLHIAFDVFKVIALVLMLLSSIFIFLGIFILGASYCFFTVEGLEARNLFTYGGREITKYPVGVFNKNILWFFTFIFPFAFVNYYPLLYVTGKLQNPIYAFSPMIAMLFLIPCIFIFEKSSRRYLSTGS